MECIRPYPRQENFFPRCNELMATTITDYANKYSMKLPDEVCNYHEWAKSKNELYKTTTMSLYQARFLSWMAQSIDAKRILEIGSFLGFSMAMWSSVVGSKGSVTGIEQSRPCVRAACERLRQARCHNTELLEGDIHVVLRDLTPDKPYDLIYIDAHNPNYPRFLDIILERSQPGNPHRILRKGGLVVADNSLRHGSTVDRMLRDLSTAPLIKTYTENLEFEDLNEMDHFNRVMFMNPRLEAILMPLFEGLSMGKLMN